MKIGVDARSLRREGVGRYIRDLVNFLAERAPEHDYYVFVSTRGPVEGVPLDHPRVHLRWAQPWPLFVYQCARERLDLFHATDHWYTLLPKFCPLVITFHDLIVKTSPEVLAPKSRLYGRYVAASNVMLADKILTVSRFNEGEILRHYPRAAGKISVIYHGISPLFAPLQHTERLQEVRARYKIPPRYFLYVGSLRGFKNLFTMMQAFSLLPEQLRSPLALVVAARVEPRYAGLLEQVKGLGIHEMVRFVGYLPTEDLVPLYSGALAFITVSLYESFCYPVVEAMACGAPVIAPAHLALPEITNSAAMLVAPRDPHAIKEAMERMLTDEALRRSMIEKGLSRAADFSQRVAMDEVVKVYNEVLSR